MTIAEQLAESIGREVQIEGTNCVIKSYYRQSSSNPVPNGKEHEGWSGKEIVQEVSRPFARVEQTLIKQGKIPSGEIRLIDHNGDKSVINIPPQKMGLIIDAPSNHTTALRTGDIAIFEPQEPINGKPTEHVTFLRYGEVVGSVRIMRIGEENK